MDTRPADRRTRGRATVEHDPPGAWCVGESDSPFTGISADSAEKDALRETLTQANIARVYDYWLCGKNNFAVDRELAEHLLTIAPDVARLAQENRAFLARAVQYVAEQGVRQFVDVGSGFPTSPNVHEVARRVIPARVAYVDNDPVVLSHGRALLASGGVTVTAGDVREPEKIISDLARGHLIDFAEPVCLLLLSVMHFIGDEAEEIVDAFTQYLPVGSYLVISAGTSSDPELTERFTAAYTAGTLTSHSPQRIGSWFHGFEVVEPGLVEASQWRPEMPPPLWQKRIAAATILAGVGWKPGESA